MSALMSQFDIARESLNTALNKSEGSAERELENYQKGIEYSIDKFKAQFQELSTSAISSDIFKGAVDSGTALVSVLEKIVSVSGGIPALFSSLATFFSMRNGLGKQLMFQNMFNNI